MPLRRLGTGRSDARRAIRRTVPFSLVIRPRRPLAPPVRMFVRHRRPPVVRALAVTRVVSILHGIGPLCPAMPRSPRNRHRYARPCHTTPKQHGVKGKPATE
ncbi:hypothetical protein DA2_1296 [Desulfovibrio sp. A2]|nr:hypothetical protein DA2_1296 [Desulfovibrio sp. A2]